MDCGKETGTILAWMLGLVAVAVLIYMGCSCMSSSYTSSSDGGKSARAVGRAKGNNSNMDEKGNIVHAADMNHPHEPPEEGMAKVNSASHPDHEDTFSDGMPKQASKSHPDFMNTTHDKSQSDSFKPVDKNGAKRGANTRANATMLSSRADGPNSRTVGMNVLLFDQCRGSNKVPIGSCNVSFLDSDSRQMIYAAETNCFAKENCPWNECKA